jgi:dihydroflavonol-4-reductase
MLVVLTGATGHIGANLTRALLEQGRPVRALVRPHDTRALEGLAVEQFVGDVLDPQSLDRAFAGADVVYHLAAHISITGDDDEVIYRVNVEGTRNVVQACERAGVRRLIHFSSVHAYEQAPLDQPIDEQRPLADQDGELAYDRSKARGEKEVLEGVSRGLDAVIVNPGGVLGPYDYKPSRMGEVILDLCRRRLPAVVAGGYNWVDVRDVVSGAMAAEQRGRRGEKYLLTGHFQTLKQLADLVAQSSGIAAPRMVTPMWVAKLSAPIAARWSKLRGRQPKFTPISMAVLCSNGHFRHDKATRELNYHPRPIDETIDAAVSWFRESGHF